jgi:hypothetical protein
MDILKIHASKLAKHGDIDYEAVVKLAEGFNGADLRNICTEAGMFAIRDERDYTTQDDFMKVWWVGVLGGAVLRCVCAGAPSARSQPGAYGSPAAGVGAQQGQAVWAAAVIDQEAHCTCTVHTPAGWPCARAPAYSQRFALPPCLPAAPAPR